MKRILLRSGAAVLMLAAAACSHQSSSTYNSTEVGRVIDTSRGVVVSSRVVEISGEGEQSGYGPLLGAAGGATAGHYIGDGSGNVIATVLGGLIGAGIGWAAEQRVDSREGIEYVLRLDNGRDVTLVQNRASEESPLPAGTSVLIQRGGGYSRVIPAPAAP